MEFKFTEFLVPLSVTCFVFSSAVSKYDHYSVREKLQELSIFCGFIIHISDIGEAFCLKIMSVYAVL